MSEIAIDWAELVAGVQRGDDAAVLELYDIFNRGIRFYLCRHLGCKDLDDRVHDVFVTIVCELRKGTLREPARLMGFVRTVTRFSITAWIDEQAKARNRDVSWEDQGTIVDRDAPSPEALAIDAERRALIAGVLGTLRPRDREILTRFYLHEQPKKRICDEMRLSGKQYELLKSRAKARFGQQGQRALRRPILPIDRKAA